MKRICILIISCLLMLFTFGMIACGCQENNGGGTSVSKPTLEKSDVAVEVFEQLQLKVNDYDGTIIWSSKDETIAIVSDTGVLQGVSEGGSEGYAKCESLTLTCNVTVLFSANVPSVSLGNTDKLEMLIGDEYKVEPYVLYGGKKYYNGVYSFKVYDETIASVSADGTVKGLKIGETELEISANWETYKNDVRLKTVIPVTIKENVNVQLLGTDTLELYTYAFTAYGKTYATEKQLEAVVEIGGEKADSQYVVWESSNESVVKVDANGKATAIACGSAQITASYENGEKKYSSLPLTVTVSKPEIDGTHKYPLLIDLYGADTQTGISCDFTPIFAESTVNVVSVTDEDGNAVAYQDGKIVSSELTAGEYVWIVDNGNYSVKTNVFVATKILYTAEDLARIQEYGKLKTWNETYADYEYTLNSYSGYFALGADIDFADFNYGADGYLARETYHMGSWQLTNVGYLGVFEGMGRTISNVNLGFGGLFGNVSANATIRNFIVDNAVFKANTSGVIGCSISGRVENVTINVDMQGRRDSSPIGYLFYDGYLENVKITAVNATRNDNVIAMVVYWAKGASAVKNVTVNAVEGTPMVYVDRISLSDQIEVRTLVTDSQENDVIVKDEQWKEYA